jgi:hypothetical protein
MTILFGEDYAGKLYELDTKGLAFVLLEAEQNWSVAQKTSWLEIVSSTYGWLQEISLKAKGSRRSVIIKEICANIKTLKRRKHFDKFRKQYPRTPISRTKDPSEKSKKPSYFLTTDLESVCKEIKKPQKQKKTNSKPTTTTEQVYDMLKSEAFISFYDNAFFNHVEGEKKAKSKKAILKDLALLLETA